MNSLLIWVLLLTWSGGCFAQTAARKRALLIGNQAYTNAKLPPIPAAAQELDLVKNALKDAGFDVSAAFTDTKKDELPKHMDEFVAKSEPGDICVFYYSGYTAQDGSDDLLLPVDFDPAADTLSSGAYPVTNLLRYLDRKKVGLKMFFLEGARKINEPLGDPPMLGMGRPTNTGTVGEYIFFIPTFINRYIDTPLDQVGLFTATLAEDIRLPGSCLNNLMLDIPRQVREKSKEQQEPITDNRRTLDFCFHDPIVEDKDKHPRSQNRNDRDFYVWIPPGTFQMGCVPDDTRCDKNELPRHQVTLTKGFWMDENEVRVQSYKNFIAAQKNKKNKNGKKLEMPKAGHENDGWKAGDHPMNSMTWDDAVAYCTWVGGRLPTEAEWEYAARGGKDGKIYPIDAADPEKARGQANFYGTRGNDNYPDTAPVRSFDVGAFGLYDMAGNVWELVSDYFGRYPDTAVTNPAGPATGSDRVKRGASYDADPIKHFRLSLREKAGKPWPNVGFRCVIDDTEHTAETLQKP